MHNNFYFLRQLIPRLEEILLQKVLQECFSQNRDELIFRFEDAESTIYIKALLTPEFCCLSFPNQFHRSRKNSADIFPAALHGKVVSIKQYLNERAFLITLDNDYRLVFKMHGNRSNIILFQKEENVAIFKNNLLKDKEITFELDRPIDQSFEHFLNSNGNINLLFPTFGKPVMQYLSAKKITLIPLAEQWHLITEVKEKLEDPSYYIIKIDDDVILSLLDFGEIISVKANPLDAINEFFYLYTSENQLEKQKRKIAALLDKKRHQQISYLTKTREKLLEIEKTGRNEHLADLIMANLYAIPSHAQEIELIDFFTNNPVKIKLKKDLSPQKNAEDYYRKGKNKRIEIEQLKSNIKSKESQQKETERLLIEVSKIDDAKKLKDFIKSNNLQQESSSSDQETNFREFIKDGFKILVGKNAKNNDELTQHFAWKEDLWLHAKDVAGSHVVIKYQSGKNFPKPVIEYAAKLAAYYSKRKTDSLCPVIYTPKKFVRKPKGSPPGSVVVEKENIIMVPPATEEEI